MKIWYYYKSSNKFAQKNLQHKSCTFHLQYSPIISLVLYWHLVAKYYFYVQTQEARESPATIT